MTISQKFWRFLRELAIGLAIMLMIFLGAISALIAVLGFVDNQYDALAVGVLLAVVFAFAGYQIFTRCFPE